MLSYLIDFRSPDLAQNTDSAAESTCDGVIAKHWSHKSPVCSFPDFTVDPTDTFSSAERGIGVP